MQNGRASTFGLRQRFQWGSYGFLPGLLLGLILGWLFHGFFSLIFRFGIALLFLIPLVVVFLMWRRWNDRGRHQEVVEPRRRSEFEVIDAGSYVIETRPEHEVR